MRTTIDAAGRIVIPKAIREELALDGRLEVDVTVVDGRIEIEVPLTPMHLERRGKVLVAVPDVPLPPLTQEIVRETLEKIRRERGRQALAIHERLGVDVQVLD